MVRVRRQNREPLGRSGHRIGVLVSRRRSLSRSRSEDGPDFSASNFDGVRRFRISRTPQYYPSWTCGARSPLGIHWCHFQAPKGRFISGRGWATFLLNSRRNDHLRTCRSLFQRRAFGSISSSKKISGARVARLIPILQKGPFYGSGQMTACCSIG